jgi:hypothetical protein
MNTEERAMSLVAGGKRGWSYWAWREAGRKKAKNPSPGVRLSPISTSKAAWELASQAALL